MQRTVLSLVLTILLLGSLWPVVGTAEEPSELKALLGRLQQESGRLPQAELQEQLRRLQQEIQQVIESPDVPIAPDAITSLPPGFGSFTRFSGLTDPRGFTFNFLSGFPCCNFFVEQSLNRVSRRDCSTSPCSLVPFATGLSTPTDLLAAPGCCPGPFGNFLYVTESGANRISKIDQTGAVTTFASFTSAPKRMAFSPDVGAFGTPAAPLLFVSLADGRVVKVDPTGTVAPCASGLSGPEGLAFGPGGSAFKDVLFVVESAGNTISKVSPACTISPFPTTGLPLNAPVTLAISPGGAWGLVDTLYVVNATTRVDRVDKNGNVTQFAGGFTKADTVQLPVLSFPSSSRLAQFSMNVSDAGAGTIEGVFVRSPFLSLQLSGCNPCKTGETFAISLTVENPSPISLPVEVKAGFRLLDGTPVNLAPLLNNKHFETTLPQGFMFQGLWLSFPVPAVPPGRYCYEAGMNDPELFEFQFPRRVCFTVLP